MALMVFFKEIIPEENIVPGAVIEIQSFGGFLGFNLHLCIFSPDD
jgi:hypothetical protein